MRIYLVFVIHLFLRALNNIKTFENQLVQFKIQVHVHIVHLKAYKMALKGHLYFSSVFLENE